MASTEQELVNRMYQALNAHDADSLATFYSDDCEIAAPVGEMRGREAVRELAQAYWNAFSDLKWTVTDQYVSDDTVVTEEVAEGTHDGTLVTPQGELPATSTRVATRICEVSRVQGGEIVSLHLYWDNLGLMQALGAIPEGG